MGITHAHCLWTFPISKGQLITRALRVGHSKGKPTANPDPFAAAWACQAAGGKEQILKRPKYQIELGRRKKKFVLYGVLLLHNCILPVKSSVDKTQDCTFSLPQCLLPKDPQGRLQPEMVYKKGRSFHQIISQMQNRATQSAETFSPTLNGVTDKVRHMIPKDMESVNSWSQRPALCTIFQRKEITGLHWIPFKLYEAGGEKALSREAWQKSLELFSEGKMRPSLGCHKTSFLFQRLLWTLICAKTLLLKAV